MAKSIKPVEIAASGISGCCGPKPSPTCAKVIPPRSLIALTPSVPSESPSGENDAAGELADIDRQRAHENVDRLALAASIVFAQGQPSVLDAKDGVGRHDIDVVDLDGHAVGGDPHRQIGIAAHDLMKETFPVGTEMGHDDQCEPRLWRQTAKKSFQRFDAAS